MNTPNRSIPLVPEGTLDPAAGLNDALQVLDALVQTAVISMAIATPPVSNADGDLYIVGSPATGDWAGHENDLARYVLEGDFWLFYEAGTQVSVVLDKSTVTLQMFDDSSSPGSWTTPGGFGGLPIENTDSPSTSIPNALGIVFGDGFDLTEMSGDTALVELKRQYAPVVTTGSAATTAEPGDHGSYTRFTHATATYTFGDRDEWIVGSEFHGRYAGSGTLTIVAGAGFTINEPADGTLVIPPDGTFTVKIVSGNSADLFGQTVPV